MYLNKINFSIEEKSETLDRKILFHELSRNLKLSSQNQLNHTYSTLNFELMVESMDNVIYDLHTFMIRKYIIFQNI